MSTDSRLREKYKLLSDRALPAVGFLGVEQGGALGTAHGALMDHFEDFLEVGEPLSGKRQLNHHAMAMEYLDRAEAEARDTFRAYLTSENPTTRQPTGYLDVNKPAHLRMLDNRDKLSKLLDLSDYAGELLQRAEPYKAASTAPEGAYSHPQPLRLLHPDRVPHRLLKAYTSEPLRLLYPDRVPHSPLKAHISQPLRLLHPDRVSEAFCTPRCQVALKSQHQSRPPGLSPGDHTADLQSPKRPKSDLPKPQDVEIGRLLSCDPLKVTITETATHISINK